MKSFYKDVIKLLKGAGFSLKRNPNGSHEIWSDGKTSIVVSKNCKSRHTANAILKDAGIDKKLCD